MNDSSSSIRGGRGGDWFFPSDLLLSSFRSSSDPTDENNIIGFCVASIATPGDFDGEVDGQDSLKWQHVGGSAIELAEWQAHYGETRKATLQSSLAEHQSLQV